MHRLYGCGGGPLSLVTVDRVVVVAWPVSFMRCELSGTVWSDIWLGVR